MATPTRLAWLPILALAIHSRGVAAELHFPKNEACGLVTVCGAPELINGFTQRGRHARVIGHAAGDVTVPDAAWVLLELKAENESQRSAIRSLPTTGVRGLRITGGALDRATIAHVCRMTSLELLELRDCRLPEDAFLDQRGLPLLAHFSLHAEAFDASGIQLARWMRTCPQLQYAYCRPELLLAGWEQLAGHPTLNFVNVTLDQDAVKVLQQLKTLTNLQGLNIYFGPHADPDYADALTELDGLKWINWSGGRVGKRELECLAEMKDLESLVLQGQTELPEEFLDGLPALVQLRRLVINTSNVLYKPSQLLRALVQLPALEHWPRIENLDADGFDQLAQCTNVVSLELSDIDSSVDRQRLKEFLGKLRLERLSLPDEDLDDVDFLASQDRLESLKIAVRRLRGDQLSALGALPDLKELHINVNGAGGLSYAPLARCPSLEALYITGELMAASELGKLRRSSSLRSLHIDSGYIDDAAAEWLSAAEGLQNLSLGRDAMLTDAGLQALTNNESLESLDVGGLISSAGAESLATLPRLRWLVVRSRLLSEHDQDSLQDRLANVPSVSFLPYDPLRGPWEKGDDGFLRVADHEARTRGDELEGQPAPSLHGPDASNAAFHVDLEKLRGKVVLVDFWGVWCGPCLNMNPLIDHLQNIYGEAGLCIVGVHSQQGAEGADEYLRAHPKVWPTLVDSDGAFANAYGVTSYPSLYLIDKQGRLRVALPHVLGLESAVANLLSE